MELTFPLDARSKFCVAKIDLARINSKADFGLLRGLLVEYSKPLGVSLCFQQFDEELSCLDKIYGPPRGVAILATREGELAGCVCLREIDQQICEMRRLYVRPAFRGLGIGRQLADSILVNARILCYKLMRLETLASMKEAIALYQSLGFHPADKDDNHPNALTIYMERVLPGC